MGTDSSTRETTVTWSDPSEGLALLPTLDGIDYLRKIAAGDIPGHPSDLIWVWRSPRWVRGRSCSTAIPMSPTTTRSAWSTEGRSAPSSTRCSGAPRTDHLTEGHRLYLD